MKIASIADVKARLSAYLKASARGPVVITKNGKPVGVLLSVGDEDELERLLMAYSPKLRGILDAARARIRQGAGIPHEDFWAKVERSESSRKEARANGTRSIKRMRRSRRQVSGSS
jgi:prevent-host-death family protein